MSIDPAREAHELPARSAFSPGPHARLGVASLGVASLGLAVLAVALEALAIAIGSAGQWQIATLLAWFIIGSSAVAFVLGLVAILAGRGRRWGAVAVPVSLMGNPLILVGLFAVLGGTR